MRLRGFHVLIYMDNFIRCETSLTGPWLLHHHHHHHHNPGVELLFVDTLSRAHDSPIALDYVTKYCATHDISNLRVIHDANLLSFSF